MYLTNTFTTDMMLIHFIFVVIEKHYGIGGTGHQFMAWIKRHTNEMAMHKNTQEWF